MKTLFDVLKTTFLTVSAIIGAGFITGRELVGYFGTENFEVYAIVSGVLFFAGFCLIYFLGKNHDNYGSYNRKMLGDKGGAVLNGAVLIAAFVSLCSLFATMDALTAKLGIFGKIPVLSIVAILIVSCSSKYGIKGLEKINSVLIPLVLIAVILTLAFKGDFKLDSKFTLTPLKSVKTVLYVTMNAFINLPIIFNCAYQKSNKTLIISAVLSAVILSGLTFFMLGAIAYGGEAAKGADMPLLSAVGGGYAFAFSVALFTAVAASVTTAYYPLYEFAVKVDGKRGVILLGVFSFAFSRLGLKNIVDYVYPIIGVFGLIYLCVCIGYSINKNKNKKHRIIVKNDTHNNRISINRR